MSMALKVKEIEAQYKDEADSRAREIIATAIQRCAADHASEMTVSVVPLPNDEMKGRIIGREGRNIRAIETLTGCDLIIDDTPEAITALQLRPRAPRGRASWRSKSSFRTAASTPPASRKWSPRPRRRSTPPSRPRASAPSFETNIHGLHPELIKLLGRMKYRTSYGQNVLNHSIEVAHIAGLLAAELGVDVATAKRAGLLHDLGKSIDHEVEGSHVTIGVDIARKYKESDEVIHAIEAHHGDVEAAHRHRLPRSGGRRHLRRAPRRPAREHRELCQASRKARGGHQQLPRHRQAAMPFRPAARSASWSSPRRSREDQMVLLARDIAKKIEDELTYPGQIKVNRPARDQGRRLREVTQSTNKTPAGYPAGVCASGAFWEQRTQVPVLRQMHEKMHEKRNCYKKERNT